MTYTRTIKLHFLSPYVLIWTTLASLLCFLCSSASLSGAVGMQRLPCRSLRLRFFQTEKNLGQHLSYTQYKKTLLGAYPNEAE